MTTCATPVAQRRPLFLFGAPGDVGGAATKIAHLIKLLRNDFSISVIAPEIRSLKDRAVRKYTEACAVKLCLLKDLPEQLDGVALAICGKDFFGSGAAAKLKARGLKLNAV